MTAFAHPEWIKDMFRTEPDKFLHAIELYCMQEQLDRIENYVLVQPKSVVQAAKDALSALGISEDRVNMFLGTIFDATMEEPTDVIGTATTEPITGDEGAVGINPPV